MHTNVTTLIYPLHLNYVTTVSRYHARLYHGYSSVSVVLMIRMELSTMLHSLRVRHLLSLMCEYGKTVIHIWSVPRHITVVTTRQSSHMLIIIYWWEALGTLYATDKRNLVWYDGFTKSSMRLKPVLVTKILNHVATAVLTVSPPLRTCWLRFSSFVSQKPMTSHSTYNQRARGYEVDTEQILSFKSRERSYEEQPNNNSCYV